MYLASSAVVCDEALKIAVCLMILWRQAWQENESFSSYLRREVFQHPRELCKMAVVAGLYTVQKNMLYLAVSNLDAAVFQVTYQFKNLTTAIFSCIMLGRTFSSQQLMGLLLLTAGVALVQVDQTNEAGSGEEKHADQHTQVYLHGIVAVLTACCTSGFAGVYLESVLKGGQVSVFAKNLQLSAWALIFATLFGVSKDWATIQENGFFYGYTPLVGCVIILEAGGGLVVAVVVKYADSVLKT